MGYEIEMLGIPDRFKSEMIVVIYMGRQSKSNRSKCLLFGHKRGWDGNDKYWKPH